MDSWDSTLRGPQMSSPTGLTIFKYQLPVLESFSIELPENAELLCVESVNGLFWLWAKVDLRNQLEKRNFMAFKTGATIPDNLNLKYIGLCKLFVQMELGLYMFEVL